MFIMRDNFEKARKMPHYRMERAVTHRGKAGMKYFEERGYPPLSWFESPAKSAETIVAIDNIRVIGQSVCYECLLASNIYSPYYKDPVDMGEILSTSNPVWLDC